MSWYFLSHLKGTYYPTRACNHSHHTSSNCVGVEIKVRIFLLCLCLFACTHWWKLTAKKSSGKADTYTAAEKCCSMQDHVSTLKGGYWSLWTCTRSCWTNGTAGTVQAPCVPMQQPGSMRAVKTICHQCFSHQTSLLPLERNKVGKKKSC